MSIRNLDCIFKPKRIAVVGASDDKSKVGYMVLRNLIGAGYSGVVYPVNSRREAVQGIPAYARIDCTPHVPDLAVICTPAATVPGLIDECGAGGVQGLVILTAGFREAGTQGQTLEQSVRDAWRRYDGMRIIGPNCLGVMAPHIGLNASFAADAPPAGNIALVSQSGALCTSLLDWAVQQNIGFSHFVSIGNMLDVGFGDLIDYFGEDPQTRSIILYVESISDARGFMSAARAFSRTKPIVAYKAGRFAESAHAAASHTGAMAGEDAVCDSAFQRAGIERVAEMGEVFDCAELLARQKLPRGPRLAIVTNAGGPGVMATDSLIALGGQLARLSDDTLEHLNAFLPAWWSHGNPVDVLGDAGPDRFGQGVETVLADEGVDAVLAILTPQSMTDPTATAARLAGAAAHSRKPLLSAWIGGSRVREGNRLLGAAGVATYPTPEAAVSAFMHLVSYARNLETLYETPLDLPVTPALDRAQLRRAFDAAQQTGHEILTEAESKSLLEASGIAVTRTLTAASLDEALAAASQVGYPVALKILSPQITHKTDVGGVALNVRNAEGLRMAFSEMMERAGRQRPDATLHGVTVQPMISLDQGVELIAGMKCDATFGAVMMVGAGGITAELYRDRALGLPPLNERLALRMLTSLRSWPLLNGYRGKPRANVERLIETLIRLSYLVAHCPEIRELDINPLFVSGDQVIALDGRVVIDRQVGPASPRPFAHLAIRPWPEEFVRQTALRDGQPLNLRPIRPEDEPLWLELVEQCSPETLHARFQYLFRKPTHEVATRYCCVDYDRELAIMAEIEREGQRRFIGVGRLIADPDHESAEFAVLVADAWQNRGLGMMLTDYCLEIAQRWGIRRINAQTTFDNPRMLAIFNDRGFQIERNLEDRLILVDKSLAAASTAT
ncbi:MAG: GNAT family N-acetyltransferase [Planctomycetales bacterium]